MDYQGLKILIPKRTSQWSTSDVCKWLKYINLQKYAPNFQKLSIDGSCLRLINQRDLTEQIGVCSKIVCKKFLNWIIFGLQQFDNTFSAESSHSIEQLPPPVAASTQQTQQTQYPLESDPVEMKQSVKKKQYQQILVLKRVQGKQHIFYKFKQRDCRIGRDQNCEIQISGDNIDPFHIHISHRNGSYYLRNLSAQSSTFIKVQTRIIIFDGMIVQMGSNVFRFQIQEDLRLSFRIFQGKNVGQIYKFSKNKGKITLGRKPGNDICFNRDNTLSNLHAKMTYSNLFWYLEDLATTNGTWVQINQEQRINTGMVFKLGQTNYQFECELRKSRQDHQIQEHVVLLPKQNEKCLLCKKNVCDILFVPCNHCAVCEYCSNQQAYCVICHCKISSNFKLFRS